MNTYTDPKLLELAGAVDMLPILDLNAPPNNETLAATGTDDAKPNGESLVAGNVAGTTAKTLQKMSKSGSYGDFAKSTENTKKPHNPKEIAGFFQVGVIGFEPTTLWSQTRCASQTALHPDPPA